MISAHHDRTQPYLQNPAEKLVLQGYRRWMMGFMTQKVAFWEEAWNLFCVELGAKDAKRCMSALISFVKTLGACATCPLKILPPDDGGLCRDECLILGLIAGLQHGDDASVDMCLTALSCQTRCDDVAFAAKELSQILHTTGLTLSPVPLQVLMDIAYGEVRSKTLH